MTLEEINAMSADDFNAACAKMRGWCRVGDWYHSGPINIARVADFKPATSFDDAFAYVRTFGGPKWSGIDCRGKGPWPAIRRALRDILRSLVPYSSVTVGWILADATPRQIATAALLAAGKGTT